MDRLAQFVPIASAGRYARQFNANREIGMKKSVVLEETLLVFFGARHAIACPG